MAGAEAPEDRVSRKLTPDEELRYIANWYARHCFDVCAEGDGPPDIWADFMARLLTRLGVDVPKLVGRGEV